MQKINTRIFGILLMLISICQLSDAQSQLWGLTNYGGLQFGTIFSIAPGATSLTNQINLPGIPGNGSGYISLTQGSNGGLFGMTPGGGVYGEGGVNGSGIIFEYVPSTNTYIEKINMIAATGYAPSGSLIQASNNLFYGMTSSGGANSNGVIFSYDAVSNTYTDIYDFDYTNGSTPFGSLMQAGDGNLYGMTNIGGANGYGVLFQYNIANSTFTDIHDFDLTDGGYPTGNILQASDNNLYGMTTSGGASPDGYLNGEQGDGVIFQYSIVNSTYFKLFDMSETTGKNPTGSLFQASNGLIYGMTNYGGANPGGYINGGQGYGVLFTFDITADTYTDILDLSLNSGTNGYGTFIQGLDGNLYAMTNSGGANNAGTIFQYNPTTNVYTDEVDLTTDGGSYPTGSLMQASDGNIYGLANNNSIVFSAVIFQYNPNSNVYVNEKLISSNTGSDPQGSLTKGANNSIWGMTYDGGANGQGVIFQYDQNSQTYTDKFDLTTSSGINPFGSMFLASDGNFYGLCSNGGANSSGVIFQYNTTANSYNDIYDFTDATGTFPYGSLIQGNDGLLYGMTNYGGANESGVLFKFDPNSKAYTDVVDLIDANGTYPYGSLVLATNGLIYGMTSSGGANESGVIFSFNPENSNYSLLSTLSDATGDYPYGSMIQATDGNLYGLTSYGGANYVGVLFQYNIESSTYNDMIDFTTATGASMNGTLLQALNGNIYGAATHGGANGAGDIFQYVIATNTFTDEYDFSYVDGFFPEFGNLIEICTPPDVPSLSASANPICPGGSTTLSIAGNLHSATCWHWYSGSCGGTSLGIGASVTVSPSATTTYYARAEGACTSTTDCQSITITVASNPTPSISGGSFCQGSSTTLTASASSSYLWSDGSSNSTLTVSTAGAYSVTTTNSTGCSGTASISVSNYSSPTASITGTTTACASVSLTATGGNTYSWNGGNNTSNATNTFTASGTYSVIVTDGNGCTGSASQTITVNPLPTATITGNTSGCTTVTLTATGGNTYQWSGGTSPSSAINSFTSSGTYTVSVTDANGCVGSASQSVTIYSLPSVTIGSISADCLSNGSITLSGSPAGGTFSGNGVSGTSFTPAAAGVGTSTITYTYTNGNGCSNSASTSATVNANPAPQITSGSNSICSGANASLVIAPGYSSYHWSTGVTTNSITVNDSGVFVVTVTNAAGCSGTASEHIAVIPSPTAFISTSNGSSICAGTTDELDAGAFEYYLWSNGSTNEFVNVTTTGTYTVTVTGTDGCSGVSAPKTITVNANPTPTITASGAITFCQGGSVTLSSGQTYSIYNWGIYGASSSISATASGTYTLIVTNSNGCTGSASQSVTVNAKPTLTISSSTNVSCAGLTNGAATVTASGGSTPYSYSWNTSPVKTTAAITSLATGTYSVTVTNSISCTASISIVISTTPDVTKPVISTNSTVTTNTASNSSTATVTLTPPSATDNCGVASVVSNHASNSFAAGTTTVIWTATDNSGNTATSAQIVVVVDNQKPTIGTASAVTANTGAGVGYAVITLSAPSASDNVGVVSVNNNHSSNQFAAGVTTVIWTATDAAGNTATSSQTVTVTDNQAPVAIAKNISVTLVNGIITITAAQVDNGSHDNVGITSESVSPNTFTCSNIGANTVTLSCNDAHGNVGTAHCTVTVVGAIPTRTITCTPCNNTYTGGDPTRIYLGYGSQSCTFNGTCSGGHTFNCSWTCTNNNNDWYNNNNNNCLSSSNCLFPCYTPTSECYQTFTCTTTNDYGCSSTTTQSVCCKDVRDQWHNGNVIVCHHQNRCSWSNNAYSCSAGQVPSHICSTTGTHATCGGSDNNPDHLGYHNDQDCDNDDNRMTQVQKVTVTTDVEFSSPSVIELFPNPADNSTMLYFDGTQDESYTIRIFDNTGRMVNTSTGNAHEGENAVDLNVSNLAQGFYLVSIQTTNGIFKAKMIKE